MNNRLAERVRDLWRRVAGRDNEDRADSFQTLAVDLPFTNTLETCQLLLERLEQLNRAHTDLQPREKLRHLEAFGEPVSAVTERLHQITQDVTLPVRPSIVETALNARKLFVELALGYKSVLNDICADEVELVDVELPRIAVERGIEALNQVLQLSYALYWPAPTGVWKQLHQLYQFALRNRVAKPSSAADPNGIDAAYKKTLLMWLANPYGLTPSEQYIARKIVDQWAYLVELLPAAPKQTCFVILEDDIPPYALHWHLGQEVPELYISTHKLCAVLEQHAHDHAPLLGTRVIPSLDFDANSVAQRLAPELSALWCSERVRSYERRQSAVSKLLTVGLGGSHYFLSNRTLLGQNQSAQVTVAHKETSELNAFDPSVLPRSAVFHGKPSDSPTPYRIHSANTQRANELPLRPTEFSLPQSKPSKDSEHSGEQATHTYPKVLCRVINESSTGACLLIRGRQEITLRVGELITLFALGDERYRTWGIGNIRWLRHFRGEYVMVGVEKLVAQANAVATKVCDPSGKYSDYLRSLLVTDFDPGQRGNSAPTLITAHVPYRTGDTILMHYLGEEKRLILGPTVRSTARFRQFTFEDPDALGLNAPPHANAATLN